MLALLLVVMLVLVCFSGTLHYCGAYIGLIPKYKWRPSEGWWGMLVIVLVLLLMLLLVLLLMLLLVVHTLV